jgi:hypothetical protein
VRLSPLQRKELAKYLFDLSKLVFASLILKLFEASAPALSINSLLSVLAGLTALLTLVILGLKIIKGVTN